MNKENNPSLVVGQPGDLPNQAEDIAEDVEQKPIDHSAEIAQPQYNHFFVKRAYEILTDPDRPTDWWSVQKRIYLIREMERIIRTEFRNTKDFRSKVEHYNGEIDKRMGPINERIKKLRKKRKLSQMELATLLDYKTPAIISLFEKGRRYPTGRIMEWLKNDGMLQEKG